LDQIVNMAEVEVAAADRGDITMPMKFFVIALFAAFVAAVFGVSSATAATTFGPTKYTRSSGSPQTFTASFPRCGGSPCQLVVVNGNADGSGRISSASITLNGKQILGPSNFNQRIDKIVVPVALEDNDQIKVVLNSAPGSFLTVSVECDTFAAPAIEEATGVISSIWDNGTVSLSIPLANDGNVPAMNVSITGMSAGGGSYVGPTPFAYSAGTIDPDESQQLYAQFSNVNGSSPFPLTVMGTYSFGASVCSSST